MINGKTYKEMLNDCVYVVEANGNETLNIWSRWCDRENPYGHPKRYKWEPFGGWLETVGHIDDRPICISVMFNKIDGHYVCFWHATSQLVDYKMIDEWFDKMAPGLKRTDAMNVHNAMHEIERLNGV